MKTMLTAVVTALLGAAGFASAQSPGDVQIFVAPYELTTNAGEDRLGITYGTGPITIGQAAVGIFSFSGCGNFSLTVPPHPFRENATTGWRVEITPLKVVKHAATFRLRWVRALDNSGGFSPPNEDIEVTLGPGESRLIDSVPVAAGATRTDGRPCKAKAESLRVSVDFPDFDRRLIGADIWLVERLPDGKEKSQLQSLRGVPHRPMAFYFDGVTDGTKRFDIFGKIVADPQQEGVEVVVETVRARADPGQEGYQASQWFRSTVHMKPAEIVDVALPPRGEPGLANRTFSIRIQAKQIR
jgi:hypothetical protein